MAADTDDPLYRCYFEADDGTVLSSVEAFATIDEAEELAEAILESPEDFELQDPDGELVDALHLDPEQGYTVEAVLDDDVDEELVVVVEEDEIY